MDTTSFTPGYNIIRYNEITHSVYAQNWSLVSLFYITWTKQKINEEGFRNKTYEQGYFKSQFTTAQGMTSMASVEREPITGVWGQSPQGPGAEPLVRGQGAKPP